MRNSSLVAILTYREMVGRYRGSVLAILGSLIAPLRILAICIFAFGFLFRAHWGSAEGTLSTGMFALFILTTEALYSVLFPTITRFVVPVTFFTFRLRWRPACSLVSTLCAPAFGHFAPWYSPRLHSIVGLRYRYTSCGHSRLPLVPENQERVRTCPLKTMLLKCRRSPSII
jgi:hypothetical protein